MVKTYTPYAAPEQVVQIDPKLAISMDVYGHFNDNHCFAWQALIYCKHDCVFVGGLFY